MELRYKNINEIKSLKGIRYGDTYDAVDLDLILNRAEYSMLPPSEATSIELFLFDDDNNLVASDYDISRYTAIYISNNDIYFNINEVLFALNIESGNYKIYVNYHTNIIGDFSTIPMYIDSISPDRTELKININPSIVSANARLETDRQILADSIVSQITDLFYSNPITFSGNTSPGTIIYRNPIIRPTAYIDNYALNFGNNRIFKAINLKFDLDASQLDDINIKYYGSIYVKLFEPLPIDIIDNSSLWFIQELIDTYTDNITILNNINEVISNSLRGPNFDLELDQNIGIETSLKSWNDLLSSNISTNQKIIDSTLSGSFGGIELNIDYTAFDNFVFYSSAEERIRNYYYKLQLIEYYTTQINSLNNASGSGTSSKADNVLLNTNRMYNIVSGFDPFETWLYTASTSSLFTHAVTGSLLGARPYSLQSWPKYLSGSGESVLHYTTSSLGASWYTGYLASASLYDQLNPNRLVNSIPASIRENEDNSQYVLFVDMIAHHFDILWSYTNNLNNKLSKEEHPKLGAPSEMLRSVANSFGIDLFSGKKMSDLWTYKLGTTNSGSYASSGSLFTKSSEDATMETWRRIVNNIPYLLKTKGTERSIKAIMNTYGIPQTLISVREFGGPAVSGTDAALIDDRFNYALRIDTSINQAVTTPSSYVATDATNTTYEPPKSYMIRVKPTNDQLIVTAASVPIGADSTDYSSVSILSYKSGSVGQWGVRMVPTASYSGSRKYGRLEFSMITGSANSNISSSYSGYLPLFDGDWWDVLVTSDVVITASASPYTANIIAKIQKSSDYITGKVVHSGSVTFPLSITPTSGLVERWCSVSASATNNIWIGANSASAGVSGSGYAAVFQAYKEYREFISQNTFDYHTLNPAAYRGNNPTSSYYTLVKYYPFGVDGIRYDHSTKLSITSSHPQQAITNFSINGSNNTYGTAVGFSLDSSSYNYRDNEETFYTYGPESFGSTVRSQKIRFDTPILAGRLSPDASVVRSSNQNISVDTNKVVVAFSPQDQINNDIYNHIGAVNLDSYFGLPEYQYEYEYTKLRKFSEEYWKKYTSRSNINEYIRIFSLFDLSFFDMIKQLFPARVNLVSGILIEPSILEKSKTVIYKLPELTNNTYTSSFDASVSTYTSGTYLSQTSSVDLYDPYAAAIYSYTGVTFSGSSYITSSTPAILASPIGSYISGYRSSSVFSKIVYHYSSSATWATNKFLVGYDVALSSSLKKYYSKSIMTTDYRDDEFAGITDMYFNGTQLEGPGINIPSVNTLDGSPVVEYRIVSDNVLNVTDNNATTGRLVV